MKQIEMNVRKGDGEMGEKYVPYIREDNNPKALRSQPCCKSPYKRHIYPWRNGNFKESNLIFELISDSFS